MILLFLLLFPAACPAQSKAPAAAQNGAREPLPGRVERLYAQGRYDLLLALVPPSPINAPELDLYRGLALARLGRWPEARDAFLAGRARQPRNPRFLVELGGVYYRLKDFPRAKACLRQALALSPGDEYARNFLATLDLLAGNLDAALQNWNRIGRPQIAGLEMSPPPRLRNNLLQRAFAFSPLGTLRLPDLQTTEARLDNLGLFTRYRFDLVARPSGDYSLDFLSLQRNGWGAGKFDALASLLRDLPTAIRPEYYNLAGSAVNLLSFYRWDDNKRRARLSVSMPLGDNPSLRFTLFADARNENWDLSRTFRGATQPLAGLNLEKIEFGPALRVVENGRWAWQARLLFADRRFRNVRDVVPAAAFFFASGSSLEYRMRADYALLALPERRLTVTASAAAAFGRNFAAGLGPYAGAEASATLDWLPQAAGDDYRTSLQFRAGGFFGHATLDQLYELGVGRDEDRWVRGISATRDGRKGNAPLGRRYLLWNWETDKTLFTGPYLSLQLGPLVDIGKISDPSGEFGSRTWLWDPGIACRLRLFGDVVLRLSYARDLRSGSGAFSETSAR